MSPISLVKKKKSIKLSLSSIKGSAQRSDLFCGSRTTPEVFSLSLKEILMTLISEREVMVILCLWQYYQLHFTFTAVVSSTQLSTDILFHENHSEVKAGYSYESCGLLHVNTGENIQYEQMWKEYPCSTASMSNGYVWWRGHKCRTLSSCPLCQFF